MRISVGQDEHGSLSDRKSHVRHARDGIVQTVKVVDFPDDYEKQVNSGCEIPLLVDD